MIDGARDVAKSIQCILCTNGMEWNRTEMSSKMNTVTCIIKINFINCLDNEQQTMNQTIYNNV